MIAVALAVIIGVVAMTCGIVADSNHADTLTFLGVMVKTTAAQIFLAGAICTWALFASLWLLSAGIKRSKDRGIELRALKALRARRLPKPDFAAFASASGIATGEDAGYEADADGEPTIALELDHLRMVIEPELGRRIERRFYRADSSQ